MNLKTFSQWLSMFVVLMVAGINSALADAKLYIDDLTVKSGSDVEVAVNLDNSEAVCGLQADIYLPEGLTATGCAVTERTVGNTVSGKNPQGASNIYRVAMFNMDNAVYPGTEGAVFTLKLHASPLFEGGVIEVKNVMLSTPELTAVENVTGGSATVTVDNRIYIEVDVTSQFGLQPANWTGASGWCAAQFGPTVVTNDGRSTLLAENFQGNASATGDLIYQTLSGLSNGVYRVEIYAAAASTHERDGFSTDVQAGDTDAAEVYAEANGVRIAQPLTAFVATSFSEVNTVTLNGIEVTDGTVKIGLTKLNPKTNWHIIQIKGVTALVDAEEALAATVARAEAISEDAVSPAIYAELTAVVADNNKAYETGDEYKAAIDAIEAVITKANIYVTAKPTMDAMKAEVEATNVYTEAAYQEYYGQWAEKFDAGTLTMAEATALQDPSVVTGWHAAITVDNFLLSAWDTNPDFQNAPYYINTWSVEGDNDGSNFRVPFFEYWTGDDASLGERTLTATMEGMEPGKYDVSAWVRVRMKNGAEAPTYGITLSANEGEAVDVAAGEQVGTSPFYLGEYTATGVVGEDGVLKIQFNVAADNNISWLSFKNVNFEKIPEPVATEYAGVATVTTTIGGVPAPGVDPVSTEGTVTITSVPGSDVADITFSSLTFLDTEAPDVKVEGVTVTTAEDGTVNYAAEGFQVSYLRGQITVTLNGSLTGTIAPDATAPTLNMVLSQGTGLTYTVDFVPTVEPFKAEIANADFSADEPVAVGICTYAKDMANNGTTQYGAQAVEGWTALNQTDNVYSGADGILDQKAAGVFAYGSDAWLGGNKFIVPATNPEGQAEGQALGLVAVWGGDNGIVQYTQTVNLLAGEYMLQVPVYNAGGAVAFTKNLIGVDDTYATTTQYPVGQWTNEQVKFTLAEDKAVTISLGYASAGKGSNDMPHLFIDKVEILTSEDIAAAELAAAKAAALAALQTLPVGTDLFYYDVDVEEVQAAIEAAESIDAIKELAVSVFAAQVLPEEGVEYVISNTTAEGNLAVVAPAEAEETGKVTVEEGARVYFTAVEGGYVLSNAAEEGEYIFKTTGNTWTLATTTNIEEAYVLNFNLVEGGYTIQGANGLFGTDNATAGSAVYANKAADKNGVWTIAEYAFIDIANVSVAIADNFEEDGGKYYLPVTVKYDLTLEGTRYTDPTYQSGLAPVFNATVYQGEEALGSVELTPQDITAGEFTIGISGFEFTTDYKLVIDGLTVYDYNKIDWVNFIIDTPIELTDTVLAEVTFTTPAEPVNYRWTALTDDMFHEWDNANTAEAQIIATAPEINNYDNKIGQGEVASGQVVIGTSTVYENVYAALADYDFMKITFTSADQPAPRLLFNRAAQDNHQGPLFEINGDNYKDYVTVSEDGLEWLVDLNKIEETNTLAPGLANLNVIKAPWSGALNIASIELAYVAPEIAENIAEFIELREGVTRGLALTDAQVVAAGNGMYLVKDATGSIFFYGVELGATAGQILNGEIIGTAALIEGIIPAFTAAEATDVTALTITDGTITPETLNVEDAFDGQHELQLVTIEDATFANVYDDYYDDYVYGFTALDGIGDPFEVSIDDFFGVGVENIEDGATVTITGVPYTLVLDYSAYGYGIIKEPFFFPTAIEVAAPEIAINVEREVGQGYEVTTVPFDAEEAKALLGVEELTYDMVRIVNPDGTEISDYAPFDGWFNADGVAEAWGSNTKICTKFFQVIPDEQFEICDMNGADVDGATYSVKWALVAGDKKVFYNINVTFFKQQIEIAVVDLGIKTSVEYDNSEANYTFKQASISDADVQAIFTELGVTSFDDVTVYGYNPTTQELVAGYAGFDGWRSANGDFHNWSGDTTVPACVKVEEADHAFTGKDFYCYNIGGAEAQTIKTYWAYATEEKAVLVEIDFIITDIATGIASLEADGVAVEAVYSISGAKQNGLQKGINVVKFANGEIKKIFVK